MSFNRDEIRFLPTNPEFASANFGINFSEIPVVQELRRNAIPGTRNIRYIDGDRIYNITVTEVPNYGQPFTASGPTVDNNAPRPSDTGATSTNANYRGSINDNSMPSVVQDGGYGYGNPLFMNSSRSSLYDDLEAYNNGTAVSANHYGYDLNESLGDYVYGAAAEPNQDDNSHLLFEPDFGQASTFHTLDQNDSDVEARESNDESDRSVESGDSGQSGQVDESDDSGDSNDSGQSDESDDSSDSGESDGSDDENQNTNGQDQYDESVYDQDTDEEVESEQDVFESSQEYNQDIPQPYEYRRVTTTPAEIIDLTEDTDVIITSSELENFDDEDLEPGHQHNLLPSDMYQDEISDTDDDEVPTTGHPAHGSKQPLHFDAEEEESRPVAPPQQAPPTSNNEPQHPQSGGKQPLPDSAHYVNEYDTSDDELRDPRYGRVSQSEMQSDNWKSSQHCTGGKYQSGVDTFFRRENRASRRRLNEIRARDRINSLASAQEKLSRELSTARPRPQKGGNCTHRKPRARVPSKSPENPTPSFKNPMKKLTRGNLRNEEIDFQIALNASLQESESLSASRRDRTPYPSASSRKTKRTYEDVAESDGDEVVPKKQKINKSQDPSFASPASKAQKRKRAEHDNHSDVDLYGVSDDDNNGDDESDDSEFDARGPATKKRKLGNRASPPSSGSRKSTAAPKKTPGTSSRPERSSAAAPKRPNGWSDIEHNAIDTLVRNRRQTEQSTSSRPLRDMSLWTLISDQLSRAYTIARSPLACKNYWCRYGRARSGFDERGGQTDGVQRSLVTSAQGAEAKKTNTKKPSKSAQVSKVGKAKPKKIIEEDSDEDDEDDEEDDDYEVDVPSWNMPTKNLRKDDDDEDEPESGVRQMNFAGFPAHMIEDAYA